MKDVNYVDPPNPKVNLELNWEKPLLHKNFKCFRCKKEAIMEVSIDDNNNYKSITGVYCKDHYETLFEDLLAEMSNPEEYDYGDDE